MGYESAHVADIRARLSRHNSDRDVRDNKLADELQKEIRALIKQPKYAPIEPEEWAGDVGDQ